MEEIDRRIDEMPTFDLRDPKTRKQLNIDIDELVSSLNLEVLMSTEQQSDVKKPDTDEHKQSESD